MKKGRDDFEWLVRSLKGRGREDRRPRRVYGERRYETVDELVERRGRKRSKSAQVLVLLLEMLPFLLMLVLVLMQ